MEWFIDKWQVIDSLSPFLMKGLWLTFKVSMVSIILGSILGSVLGIVKTLKWSIPRALVGGYVHLFRGTPYLVQIYIIYFVLPSLDVTWLKFDSYTAAIVSLSLYTASYVTAIVESAIRAVPRGQEEAARSCGMSKAQALYHIILPQAFKLTVPPMASIYVIVIKSTAVLSVIGISELTRQGETAILRMPGDTMFIYLLIAILYFVYCYPMLKFAGWAESKVKANGGNAVL
ncbi:amino acid ABC transporter permease [Marinobacter santoriniensis NKSG1]|uniref:Amino acid ABC transporter permease n=1 Tax=Marinobacter santoriniensis NKSG1 TaxID=1288826 RepID=M7CTP7_9GAMM|nr:amino acid ABC transporter permease [Marinobacter santoriniensis]EMP56946.1 amino acid ABC transporter permease [Marinobacter santoriniensis NKSG1]